MYLQAFTGMVTPTHRCALKAKYTQIYTGTCEVHVQIHTETHMYINAHMHMNTSIVRHTQSCSPNADSAIYASLPITCPKLF